MLYEQMKYTTMLDLEPKINLSEDTVHLCYIDEENLY